MDPTTKKITNQRVAFKQKKFISTNRIEYILLSFRQRRSKFKSKKLVKLVFSMRFMFELWIYQVQSIRLTDIFDLIRQQWRSKFKSKKLVKLVFSMEFMFELRIDQAQPIRLSNTFDQSECRKKDCAIILIGSPNIPF